MVKPEVCHTSGLFFGGDARGVPHPLPSAGYRTPHNIRMYEHTDEACMSPKDPAPPIHPRVRMRMNILWPLEGPREQPRVLCRSVHMCESNGSLLPVQMAGSTCAVVGPSAQHEFELK